MRGLEKLARWSLAILAMTTALDGADPQNGPYLPRVPFDYADIVLPDYYRSSNFPGGRRTRGLPMPQIPHLTTVGWLWHV